MQRPWKNHSKDTERLFTNTYNIPQLYTTVHDANAKIQQAVLIECTNKKDQKEPERPGLKKHKMAALSQVIEQQKAVANSFVQFYYTNMATNRQALGSLYQQNSMYTDTNGATHQGVQAIGPVLMKLPKLNFDAPSFSIDVQPSNDQNNGMLVFVNGSLTVDAETNKIKFSQTFQLMSTGGNNFYIRNDMFRLNVG